MDYNKAQKLIKKLITIVEREPQDLNDKESYIQLGSFNNKLTFRGSENVKAYHSTIDYLLEADNEIAETISYKTMKNKVLSLIRNSIDKEEVTIEEIRQMYKDLRNKPKVKYEVLYPVFGVNYKKKDPLEIGPYTIYNKKIHRKILIEKNPDGEKTLNEELDDYIESDVLIGIEEITRESGKANEKARFNLQRFEDTIRFMIANYSKRYDVGIFNFNFYKRSQAVLISADSIGTNSSMSGAYDIVNLHQFPINDPLYGHDKIWEMLGKSKPSDLEKRIITAIEWSGKALRDEVPSRAFVQYIFGLEALLQYQQKGVMISPSITYQISEFAAFIISDKLETRLEIEKIVKDLYAKRSAIAHGGSNNVSEEELIEALNLMKNIITALLVNKQFQEIKDMDQLNKWIKNKKYS